MIAIVHSDCGYVRGPIAATDDTEVIYLDCNQQATLSQYVPPLQLRDNSTQIAVQVVHCPTIPVGLFTNVTDNLTSVTVVSEDAVQLLEGTFEGLGHVTELRLLDFTLLKNLSRSVLQPLRNIQTLILDGFGSANIELSYLGSVIRKLAGTPIRKLVFNKIKPRLFYTPFLQVNDFSIQNASVKELIFSDAPLNYEGSIRLAFPELVYFCAETARGWTVKAVPPVWDLMLISDVLKEFVIYQQSLPIQQGNIAFFNTSLSKIIPTVLKAARFYPDLLEYIMKRRRAKNCVFGFTVKIGSNLTRVSANGFLFSMNAEKPLCFEENNTLTELDFSGSHMPETIPVLSGLKRLKYLSLENTGIKKLPNEFLQYYPSLEVLKLSKVDIRHNMNEEFFGSCPTLLDIDLHSCNMTKVPTTTFFRSVNLERLDVSNNFLRSFDFYLQNCTKLHILNLSHNSIGSTSRKSIVQLTRLASQKTRRDNLVIDLSHNKLHCLCNSTNFIKWLQRSAADSHIEFKDFNSYTCLFPNGSIVRASEVVVSDLEQQCRVIQTLTNHSDCPCDEQRRSRLQQVWVHLDGYFCRNDAGAVVPMKNKPLPSCYNPYKRASFIAPVVIGGVLGITVLIAISLLIYYRNTRHVRQVRECLEMNPVRFVRAALQYVMMHNHEEEHAMFSYDIMIFVQDEDRGHIHRHFVEGLSQRNLRFITRDDFLPGAAVVEAMTECIRVCQWIVAVLTANFLSDPVCIDFISRVQFSRPHALILVIWEKPLEVADVSVAEMISMGDPLYWPGDLAAPDNKRNFWSSLLERTGPTEH